jgi:hypothetical protein
MGGYDGQGMQREGREGRKGRLFRLDVYCTQLEVGSVAMKHFSICMFILLEYNIQHGKRLPLWGITITSHHITAIQLRMLHKLINLLSLICSVIFHYNIMSITGCFAPMHPIHPYIDTARRYHCTRHDWRITYQRKYIYIYK